MTHKEATPYCPERVEGANPISYINGNEPTFSIHHGDADCTVSSY